ncbi:endonuclease SmrB [Idiomarina seosinensis]|uniref:Ribosome rescue factor SmrB n=1 Tax=Idiomarina seosinensis TaxID=281739 RepID=A0A432ZH96_9GAMM|nr:endonuclease SmrB [Idiomarina seosinensis]RUO77273.1 endonuclease SmrB [Idiomarina seosinensis]
MKSFKSARKTNSTAVDDDERALFRDAVKGARTIDNDKIQPLPAKQRLQQKKHRQKADSVGLNSRAATDFFSDQFQGYIEDGPVRYVAEQESHYLLKQLRRGDYSPEMLLDLHGMTLAAAKQELAAMLRACEKQLIECCSIMHGHGSGRLKQQLPHWLIQYPGIRAFHQAPKEWGGDAAIVLLIKRRD